MLQCDGLSNLPVHIFTLDLIDLLIYVIQINFQNFEVFMLLVYNERKINNRNYIQLRMESTRVYI